MKSDCCFQQLIVFSVTADIISCVEFNQDGELLATGDKGGRVVIFQVKYFPNSFAYLYFLINFSA